jgi:hypothetical protein
VLSECVAGLDTSPFVLVVEKPRSDGRALRLTLTATSFSVSYRSTFYQLRLSIASYTRWRGTHRVIPTPVRGVTLVQPRARRNCRK